jgi:CPA2 family monovalent cation:H+ antiporter-2
MNEATFLRDLVVTLTAALLVLVPSRRLKLPAAVGFMLTGVLIGPGALRLVSDPHHVAVLAEVGVTMLLFMIGLEFSLARLKEIGRAFLVAGPLQVLGTMAIATVVFSVLLAHDTLGHAVFLAMLITLSSTAMVLPIYVGRGEVHAPQGRLALGILLFQDFAMVPMLVLVPALAGKSALTFGPRILIGAAGAAAVWIIARYLMPRVVGAVIRSGVRELYVMMAIAVCLGAALVTQELGLSPALGAFVAGLLVSESEYAHQIVAEVIPFRDLFSSIFFISMGMLLDPAFIAARPGLILSVLLLTLVLKSFVAGGVVRAMGYPLRIAVIVGISLAQVGEFSFVLSSVGTREGLLDATQSQIMLAVAVISLALTPFLIRFAAWAGARTRNVPSILPASAGGGAAALGAHASAAPGAGPAASAAPGSTAPTGAPGAPAAPAGTLANHVVVAGYGVNGRNVARVLRELGIPYVVLELDTAIIRRARAQGEKIQFGDISRAESLHASGVDKASVVVLAISDPAATRFAVHQVRSVNPGAHIIARTRQVAEVAELNRLGADEVIPEEFETSIAILARVLRYYHVPSNVVRLQEQALRREGYSFLRGGDITGQLMTSVSQMIAGATTDTFYLEPGSPAVGQTLASLDLRGRTRALIIAIVRDGLHTLGPGPEYELRPGDIMVLVGDHEALDAAFDALSPPRSG